MNGRFHSVDEPKNSELSSPRNPRDRGALSYERSLSANAPISIADLR